MSFEQKYLKYKQKYLEIKKDLQRLQSGGGNQTSEFDDVFNLDELTETPSMEKVYGYVNNKDYESLVGGFLSEDSSNSSLSNVSDNSFVSENFNNATENVDSDMESLGDTPVVDSDMESVNNNFSENSSELSEQDGGHFSETSDNETNTDQCGREGIEQSGGEELDTSISELDEIFSQLGGKKSKKHDSDSDSESSLSSLSDFEDSSSDFDL